MRPVSDEPFRGRVTGGDCIGEHVGDRAWLGDHHAMDLTPNLTPLTLGRPA